MGFISAGSIVGGTNTNWKTTDLKRAPSRQYYNKCTYNKFILAAREGEVRGWT